jgi:hypothetical protein
MKDGRKAGRRAMVRRSCASASSRRPGRNQRIGELGFHSGVLAAARRLFQHRDRFGDAVLQHHGTAQNAGGHRMMGREFEHIRRDTFGLIGALRPQGKDRGLQGLLGVAGRRIEGRCWFSGGHAQS